MPLVPTTKGNRVKWTASGESTAVAPIPTPNIPDDISPETRSNIDMLLAQVDPATGMYTYKDGSQYTPQQIVDTLVGYDRSTRGQMATATAQPTASAYGAAPGSPGFNDVVGTRGPSTPTTQPAPAGAYDPAVSGAYTPATSSSWTPTQGKYPWYIQATQIGQEDEWTPIYSYTAVMEDGTKYDAKYAEQHAGELMKKHYSGADSSSSGKNNYIEEYNSMYEFLKKSHKEWDDDTLNQATLQAIGLDDNTLFGGGGGSGGSGGSSGISPIAAWQLQSQNWREALPYQIPAGQEWAPGWEPGGLAEAMFKQANVPYNPDVYRAAISNPPGAPGPIGDVGSGSAAPSLPAWLTNAQQQAPQPQGPYQSFPYDFELPNPFPQQSGDPMYDRLAGAYKSNPGKG
jgi:hypothetical protein